MSASISALNTLALNGYSLPGWFGELFVFACIVSIPLMGVRMFHVIANISAEYEEDIEDE